jgi:hypothetical protein
MDHRWQGIAWVVFCENADRRIALGAAAIHHRHDHHGALPPR